MTTPAGTLDNVPRRSVPLAFLTGAVIDTLGCLIGASTLYRVIAVLLAAIALVLVTAHDAAAPGVPLFDGPLQMVAGVGAGFIIGGVASVLGVAGGELLSRP